jgi:hypothetical protein
MKSKFIGANRLVLNKRYSREDVGFKGTRSPGMRINENNENEKILFVNLGDKYDNRLTKKGLIQEPRLNIHILSEPTTFVYYLFLRKGNEGDYCYVGTSSSQTSCNNKYNIFDFNVSGISPNIVKELGGFQPLP